MIFSLICSIVANNMGGASSILSIGILRFAFSGYVKFINNTGSALRVCIYMH